jgi:ATP-dependent Lon protease
MHKDVEQGPLSHLEAPRANRASLVCLPLGAEIPFPMAVVSTVLRFSYALEAVSIGSEGTLFWVYWQATETDPRKSADSLPEIGIVCRLLSSRELGPGQIRIDLEGLHRARRRAMGDSDPVAWVEIEPVTEPSQDDESNRAKIDTCYELLASLVRSSEQYPSELLRIAELARDRADHFTDRIAAAVHLLRTTSGG